jgi:CRISPR-associated protein Cst2
MAPASIVVRLTKQLVTGYDTYGFDSSGDYPEVIDGIREGDYPGGEFYIGGKIVKDMDAKDAKQAEELKSKGVTLDRDPRRLLATVGERAFRKEGA